MRIIGGKAGGRKLATPRGHHIRPTSDRVKEALFNILAGLIGPLDGLVVLDIFAGTGNLGIEALSRGAARSVFIDRNRESASLIRKNLDLPGFAAQGRIINLDFSAALSLLGNEGVTFQLVFLDPPYGKTCLEEALTILGRSPVLESEAVVVAELAANDAVADHFGDLELRDRRIYGDTALAFFIKGEKGAT